MVQGRLIKGTKPLNLLILRHRQTVPFLSCAYISSNAHPRASPYLLVGGEMGTLPGLSVQPRGP